MVFVSPVSTLVEFCNASHGAHHVIDGRWIFAVDWQMMNYIPLNIHGSHLSVYSLSTLCGRVWRFSPESHGKLEINITDFAGFWDGMGNGFESMLSTSCTTEPYWFFFKFLYNFTKTVVISVPSIFYSWGKLTTLSLICLNLPAHPGWFIWSPATRLGIGESWVQDQLRLYNKEKKKICTGLGHSP